MDEYLNSRHKEVFLRLLTNPADTGGVYLANLQELVKNYPQAGLLRAMYGRALNENTPVVAGGYFDNRALHKLLHHHDSLLPVEATQIILEDRYKGVNGYAIIEDVTKKVETVVPEPYDIYPENTGEILTDQPQNFPDALKVDWNSANTEEEKLQEATQPQNTIIDIDTEPGTGRHDTQVEEEPLGRAPWEIEEEDEETVPPVIGTNLNEQVTPQIEPVANEDIPELVVDKGSVAETAPVMPALTPWDLIAEEYAAQAARSNGQASYDKPVETGNYINEETFDEITGIEDINIAYQPNNISAGQASADEFESTEKDTSATNYFSFDQSFGEHQNGSSVISAEVEPETVAQEGLQINQTTAGENSPHHNDVSKYHDEKMPYTFMWWLDKTRKEHDALYQPYAKRPGNNNGNMPGKRTKPDDLQQQYFENIFHLSPMDSLTTTTDEPPTIEFDMHVKEDRIIKRFITEDPHIHPPVGEKLDTENKAKKSSEDALEMVTETLARIYADQMLFPKAIATYRKLILKFPEKSRYFASRIDALEKRTN